MASFSPDTLRSTVNPKGGFSYNNKYSVTIPKPIGISNLDDATLRRIEILCDSVNIPTRSLSTTDKFIYGTTFRIPYNSTYTEAAMSFILTDSMEEKVFFDEWMRWIVDPITGNLNYHTSYVSDITIKKFGIEATDTNSSPTYEVKLIDAWPSIVGEMGLSHAAGNEIMRLPVTFQYKRWERIS